MDYSFNGVIFRMEKRPLLSKVLFIMKHIFLFLILSTLQSFSTVNYSQLTLLTLEEENSTVKEIISQIEKESEFYFTYNLAQIDLDKKVSIHMENKEISEILDKLFPEGSVKYTIHDRHVVLFKEDQLPAKNNPDKPEMPAVNQQGKTISGTVTDGTSGEPLIGVNIVVKGTTNGAVTDIDGKFSLQQIPDGAVLQVSYVGYVAQEIRVGNQTNYAIVLKEDTQSLDEVVVVGYGTQKKGEVTSSVVKITEKDFNKGPSGNPMQLVEGRVAGLVINRPGGSDPNGDITIQMRGVSSLRGNNQPLIIIDGIPGNMTTLNAIASEDIESMDVLRDGSAAAIYGTRGNNGVVIVTTKQARPRERIQLDYSGYMAHDFIAKVPDILTAEEFLQYGEDTNNTVIKNYGILSEDGVTYLPYDDVYDALLNKGNFSHNHNISASGGSANGNYTASLGYRKSEGLAITTNREQVTARLSVNQKVLNEKVLLNINLASSSNTGSSFGNMGSTPANDETSYNPFYMAIKRNPTYPIYEKDGTFYEDLNTYGEENPVASLRQRTRWYERKNLLGSVKATWTIIDGLNASAFTALEKNDNYSTDYRSKDSYSAQVNKNGGTASKRFQRLFNKTFESTIDYKKSFNQQHNLNAMLGYSYQDLSEEWFSATNYGFLTDAFETNHIGSGSWLKQGKAGMESSKEGNRLIALFGRANYNFEGKYMLSASVRREGSSKFGDNHKWGWFPAVSAGWAISEESFLADISAIDMIKLRVGYGVTGSLPNDPYMSLIKIGSVSRGYYYNGQWYSNAYGPSNNPNPDLRWEKNQSINVGVDFGFFNNRISGNIDVYQKKTTDLINQYQAQVPAMIHSTIMANVGTIMNRGVELAVNALVVDTRDFKYDANLTFSYETNKLESMSNDIFKGTYEDRYGFPSPGNIGYAQRLEEGQPIGSFFGYVYEGITEDGKWILKDLDGIEGYSNNDKRYIGNGLPKIKAGLMNNFTYKNWDFSFFLRGMFMYDILNTGRIYFGTTTNIDKSAYNVYKDALNVKLTEDPRFSNYFLESGDFLKIDNVTLGYTFQFPESKYVKSLRIYGYCSNLALITGYSGIDPEVRITGLEPGIDRRDSYPRTRTFSLGVNVSF